MSDVIPFPGHGPRLVVVDGFAKVEQGNDTVIFRERDACRRLLVEDQIRQELENQAWWLDDQADALEATLLEVPGRFLYVREQLEKQLSQWRDQAAHIRGVLSRTGGSSVTITSDCTDDEPDEPTPLEPVRPEDLYRDLGGEA